MSAHKECLMVDIWHSALTAWNMVYFSVCVWSWKWRAVGLFLPVTLYMVEVQQVTCADRPQAKGQVTLQNHFSLKRKLQNQQKCTCCKYDWHQCNERLLIQWTAALILTCQIQKNRLQYFSKNKTIGKKRYISLYGKFQHKAIKSLNV